MMDWRKIEKALVRVAKSYQYPMDEGRDTGDKLCDVPDSQINLTELAKDLAKEL